MLRHICAAVLALAVGSVPLVADWCAISCEAAHGAAAAAPACHHTSASMPHLAEVPVPCGHDHHPVVVDASTIAGIAVRTGVIAAVPSGANHHQAVAVASARRSRIEAHVSPPPLDLTLASILRI